jgi:hypothetical protein
MNERGERPGAHTGERRRTAQRRGRPAPRPLNHPSSRHRYVARPAATPCAYGHGVMLYRSTTEKVVAKSELASTYGSHSVQPPALL